jgi:hypothetical protein
LAAIPDPETQFLQTFPVFAAENAIFIYFCLVSFFNLRLFASLLLIVVLAQTLLPCMDEHPHDAMQKAIMSQTSHNDDHQVDSDCCSPFCTCHCCHSVFCIAGFNASSFYTEPVAVCHDQVMIFESAAPIDLLIPPKA